MCACVFLASLLFFYLCLGLTLCLHICLAPSLYSVLCSLSQPPTYLPFYQACTLHTLLSSLHSTHSSIKPAHYTLFYQACTGHTLLFLLGLPKLVDTASLIIKDAYRFIYFRTSFISCKTKQSSLPTKPGLILKWIYSSLPDRYQSPVMPRPLAVLSLNV